MIKVLLTGCNGRMGDMITELMAERENMAIVAGIDQVSAKTPKDYPVFSAIDEVNVTGDVIVDFSHYTLIPELLDYIEKTGIPAVICTTGIDDALLSRIEDVATRVAILRSGNMSLGINLLLDLVKKAASVLHETFDIEVIEKHHNRKLDAPSGTALMIADAMNAELQNSKTYTHGRHGKDAKRQPNEIGIHAVRGGTIVGEHSVLFAGPDEVVEIRHAAASRKVFGNGAIQAAQFLVGKAPGMYTMDDVLK
jgi:4-hydroxy-tetrahydrodipicolinate reductase